MWPRVPELFVIAYICLNTVALLNLDELGEAVWRLRNKLDSDAAPDRPDERP
jgi:hypothetical protein